MMMIQISKAEKRLCMYYIAVFLLHFIHFILSNLLLENLTITPLKTLPFVLSFNMVQLLAQFMLYTNVNYPV